MLEAFGGGLPQTPPPKRGETAITKQRAVIIVSIAATIFVLWPERFIIWRNLCLVPLLAWLTALAFDLRDTLGDAWESVPTWLKRIVVPASTNGQNERRHEQLDFNAITNQAVVRFGELLAKLKTLMGNLPQTIRDKLIEWLQRALNHLDPSHASPRAFPQLTQTRKQYYGILVRTPSVHDYGIGPVPLDQRIVSETIPWQSCDTASIPSMLGSLVFRTHVSFCLVEKAIWDSRQRKLVEKLTSGLYWDISGEEKGSDGKSWTRQQVLKIRGIEVLGLVSGGHAALDECHKYFTSLRQGWKYMKISWNDVDFAIILGLLVTGPSAAANSKKIFDAFNKLRFEQILNPRKELGAKGFMGSWCVGVMGGIATVATGGLAAPITVPLLLGSVATGMASTMAGMAISERDRVMWNQRAAACENLVRRFPELKVLFDEGDETPSQCERL